MTSIAQQKARLRKEARKKRALLAAHAPDMGRALEIQFRRAFLKTLTGPVAGYYSIHSEPDVLSVLSAVQDLGQLSALPVVTGPEAPLKFRVWSPGDALTSGPHGISEPASSAATIDPDLVLVPLLAFDTRGYRLGYGGGYYDRTLAALRFVRRIVAVGVAFAGQRVEQVPTEDHDVKLDAVLTEHDILWFNGATKNGNSEG